MSRGRSTLAALLSAFVLVPEGAGWAAISLAQGWTAPPQDAARVNPVPASPDALKKGRALYQRRCATCHGDKGHGDGPASRHAIRLPQDLTDASVQKRLTDGEIFWKLSTGLRNGREVAMPAFTKEIPAEEDRWKLVLWVRALGRPGEGSPAVP